MPFLSFPIFLPLCAIRWNLTDRQCNAWQIPSPVQILERWVKMMYLFFVFIRLKMFSYTKISKCNITFRSKLWYLSSAFGAVLYLRKKSFILAVTWWWILLFFKYITEYGLFYHLSLLHKAKCDVQRKVMILSSFVKGESPCLPDCLSGSISFGSIKKDITFRSAQILLLITLGHTYCS